MGQNGTNSATSQPHTQSFGPRSCCHIARFDPSSILGDIETTHSNDITVSIRQHLTYIVASILRSITPILLVGRTLTTVARLSDVHKLMRNEKLSFRDRPVCVHLLPVHVAAVQPRSDH
jgi:hypothetical protein